MAAETQPQDIESNDLFGRWLAHHEQQQAGDGRAVDDITAESSPPPRATRRLPTAAVASAAVQGDPMIGSRIAPPSNFGSRRRAANAPEPTGPVNELDRQPPPGWEPIVMRSARKKVEEAEAKQAPKSAEHRGRLQRIKARLVDPVEAPADLEVPEVLLTPPAARTEQHPVETPAPLPKRTPAPAPPATKSIEETIRSAVAAVEPPAARHAMPRVEPEPVAPPPLVRAFVEATPQPPHPAEPEPEAYVEPEPQPVAHVEPEPQPVAHVEPEPQPVAYVEPEPEPEPAPEPVRDRQGSAAAAFAAERAAFAAFAAEHAALAAERARSAAEPAAVAAEPEPDPEPDPGPILVAEPEPEVEVEPEVEPEVERFLEPVEPDIEPSHRAEEPVQLEVEEPAQPTAPSSEPERTPAWQGFLGRARREPDGTRPHRERRPAGAHTGDAARDLVAAKARARATVPVAPTAPAPEPVPMVPLAVKSVPVNPVTVRPVAVEPAPEPEPTKPLVSPKDVITEMPGVYKFAPRRNSRRLLTISLLIGLVLSVYFGRIALEVKETQSIGVAAIAILATAMVWAIRAGASVTKMQVHQGQLEVTQQGSRYVFDLASQYTRFEVHGEPGHRGWKVLFPRRGMPPFAVDATMVDADDFMRVLRFFRPQLVHQ